MYDNPELAEITRTPLYLQAWLSLADEEPIPTTKGQLIERLIMAHEERPEHQHQLHEAPVEGFHRRYLGDLAARMREDGTPAFMEQDMHSEISSTAEALVQTGQLGAKPSPKEVLDVLCGHHLLVRYGGAGDDVAVSFHHQQIEEWFASHFVERRILESVTAPDIFSSVLVDLINEPRWEEPILFAMERLGRGSSEGLNAAADVVRASLGIDPVFAARMATCGGDSLLSSVRLDFVDLGQRWHTESRQDRALAFVITAGLDEFSDEIWSLVGHENNQIQMGTFRVVEPFNPRCLGNDWRIRFGAMDVNTRETFAGEIGFEGGAEGLRMAGEIAASDPSMAVRVAAINPLHFRGARRHIQTILNDAPPELWKCLAEKSFDYEMLAPEHRERFIAEKQGQLSSLSGGAELYGLLLNLDRIGSSEATERIVSEVASDGLDMKAENVDYLIDRAREIDPERTARVFESRIYADQPLGRRGGGMPQRLTP